MKKSFAIIFCLLMVASIFVGCKKSDKIVINSADDLVGKKIGVQAGTTGEILVTEDIEGVKVSSFKTGMDAALDLMAGQIDAIVLDELPSKEIVSRNPSLEIIDIDLAIEEYAIAVKKGNTELLNSINKTIAEMKANGEYEALVNAFMPADGNVIVSSFVAPSSAKKLRLGTNAAFYPFEYVDGKNIVGFDITMGQKIAATYGATLDVIDMAFDSLIPALASDAIDFIAAGMSVTEERKKNVDFSDAYYSSKQVIIVRK